MSPATAWGLRGSTRLGLRHGQTRIAAAAVRGQGLQQSGHSGVVSRIIGVTAIGSADDETTAREFPQMKRQRRCRDVQFGGKMARRAPSRPCAYEQPEHLQACRLRQCGQREHDLIDGQRCSAAVIDKGSNGLDDGFDDGFHRMTLA